jgi:Icc-related predicted phosphoesterase
VHLLKGNVLNVTEKTTIGGSMGYCDFGYAKKVLKARDREMWAYWERWYDSVYIGLSREEGISLWESELQKMEKSLQLAPTIMVTHFIPSYSLVSKKWAKEITTTFFAFNGNDMLKRFGENGGKIWAFGHTHEGSAGEMNGVKLVCNPFGYPNESVGKAKLALFTIA